LLLNQTCLTDKLINNKFISFNSY